MIKNKTRQNGSVNVWMVSTIGASVVAVGLIVLSIWLYGQYNEQKTNVDIKINNAASAASEQKATQLEAVFAQREKEPNRKFVGPADYGLVTFNYPKTWSVYVNNDTSGGGDFEAYLNPVSVPPVSDDQIFALRVLIQNKSYDSVIADYDSLVQDGSLKASTLSVNGNNGTRLDGKFTDNIRGAAAIFKIRDKTLIIRTDAQTFIKSGDFDRIIGSVKINK